MKIAFLLGKFPVLSQTFVLNQITGLIDRGHDVAIFAGARGDDSVIHGDIEAYGLQNKVKYARVMPRRRNFVSRLVGVPSLFFHTKARSWPGLARCFNPRLFGADALSLKEIYRVARYSDIGLDQYDIVHCHFGTAGILAAILKEAGVINGKVVTVFHGYDVTKFVQASAENVYERLFRSGDLFLPISERWKSEVIGLGCDPHRISVHRMGIDVNRFTFCPRVPGENGEINLLTVARLVEKKGVEYGIRAVAGLVKDFPGIRYKIAGDGPLYEPLKKLIDELGLGDAIQLLGWKNQEQVLDLMQGSHILLAPSVTAQDGDQEGIPVVLMEAMALGLPVLSTRHSGIPELVQDGESGYVVEERNVGQLVQRLRELCENSERWAVMGTSGRRYVEDHYNIDTLNDKLVSRFESLIGT